MKYRILFSGGGTAGSATPLIALADQIRRQRQDVEFRFLGTGYGPERVLATAANIPFTSIDSGKLRRYWSWSNLSDLRRIWRGYQQSLHIMDEWKPDVAVSAGSFVSVPVTWAAHRRGVRTLVHQQDVRPGLANKLMTPAADVVTVAFKASAKAFPSAKVRWTGNPVRADILAGDAATGRELFHIPETARVLLVLGGGTGSTTINNLIGAMSYRIIEHWSVIHVTGPDRDFIELHSPHYQRYPFLTWQMPHALAAADVVISRAGLGALSELAALGKPSIFIPIPDSHQEDNCTVVAEASAGIILDQRVSIQSRLWEALERLRQNDSDRRRIGNNLRQFYNPDALPQLVDQVLHLIHS